VSRTQLLLLLGLFAVPVVLFLGQGAILESLFEAVGWIRARGMAGAIVFAGGYFVAGLIALPLFPLSVLAGLIYGLYWGAMVVMPAAIAAAALAGWLGSAWFRAPVLRMVAERPAWRAVFTELSDKGVRAVILNRMAPVMPFALQNYVLGAIGVRVRALAVGTLVGMQPAIWVALYLGVVVSDVTEAQQVIAEGGGTLRLVSSFVCVAALAVLVLWLGRVAHRARNSAS